ncbi:uncharacterized protein LOC112517798 [Cynara cardunculus var. scolymus]|uniref:uncharacterized protein LOC112517798 n=1 Tax=Cynara cardunculus var. scolymus TaxID=59895 RepID=UPI000D6258D3|nr:uncharacterized protein LOC112517798 [Cynara cardunculus var. scolymus]
MEITKPKTIIIGIVFLYFSMSSAIRVGKPSAYDVLKSYNLPVGILPQNVSGYNVDPTSGQFSVYIGDNCDFKIDQYEIQYNPTIKGVIHQNQIENLDGVRVQIALLWIDVKKVSRNNDQLEFQIGDFVTKDFPIGEFNKSPRCN